MKARVQGTAALRSACAAQAHCSSCTAAASVRAHDGTAAAGALHRAHVAVVVVAVLFSEHAATVEVPHSHLTVVLEAEGASAEKAAAGAGIVSAEAEVLTLVGHGAEAAQTML